MSSNLVFILELTKQFIFYGIVPEIQKEVLEKRYQNCRAHQLVTAYRTHGHLKATIDNVEYKNVDR